MKKILVPIDFSGTSRNAEEYAILLAKLIGAEVHLLHVYRDLMPATAGPEPWSPTIGEIRVDNEKLINKEVKYLRERYDVEVKADLEPGLKTKMINSMARQIQADMIVMGIRSGKRSKMLGSTVLRTIRKTKMPVLIIPDKAKFSSIKNIVLAVDFDEMIDSACFDPLLEIYQKSGSSMRVLHVETSADDVKASELPEKLQIGQALSKFTYEYDSIESFEVERGIQNFIDKHPTELLVMIAHHHTLYERIFEPVHTNALSFEMKIPLLVLKHQ